MRAFFLALLHLVGAGVPAQAVADPVELVIDLQFYTESTLTPEGLPYEDRLEFETAITGTVILNPGREEGDAWVSTEAQYELHTHLVGSATRENWMWNETTIHEFDITADVLSGAGKMEPCDTRLALRDGQVEAFFLNLPISPAHENAHVYAIRYSRARGQAEVWIRLPPPFRYADQYQVWDAPGTVTARHVEGSFTGWVVDRRGEPVSGAQVTFAGSALVTDAAGQFRVDRVAPGPLRIKILEAGFEAYDHTASMPALLAVSHTFVLEESEPVGSPLVLSVAYTNPATPLLPGAVVPVTLVLSNQSKTVVTGVGTFRLHLASSDTPSLEDSLLEQLNLAVDLPPSGQLSRGVSLRLPTDPDQARGGLGPRRVLAQLSAWAGLPETVSATPWGVSPCFWVGELLVVMTHGFNPQDPWGDDHVEAWKDFRKMSSDITGRMAGLPIPDSALSGRVARYETMWDSSTGFWPAFFSLFFSKYFEAVAWNAVFEGKLPTTLAATVVSQVLRLAAIFESQESRYLAAVSAYRVFHELRGGHLLSPADLSFRYQPVIIIGHSRGAALNARVSNYLHAAGYLVEDYVSLDGFSTDWPDDAWLIGDISIRREAFGRRKWNYRPQEGLSAWAANVLDRDYPASGILLDALGMYVSLFLKTDFSGWLPVAGVRDQLRRFDIRAPDRAAYGFADAVLPRLGGFSNHLTIQEDYLRSADELPGISNEFIRSFLGRNRATPPCSRPDYDRAARVLADGANADGRGGPRLAAADAPRDAAPNVIEPWTFDDLAAAQATLRAQTLSADADPLLRAVQRAFTDESSLLNLLYRTTGAVRLGLQDESRGHAILQGPAATLRGRIPWVSSLGQITFDLRVPAACLGGRLELSLGEALLGRWEIASVRPREAWVTMAVEVGPGAGLNDLTFTYSATEPAPCEIHLDNVGFRFSQPRLSVNRRAAEGWRVGVSCPAHYAGPVVLETSTSLEEWVPVKLGQAEHGEIEFNLPADETMASRFWRARIDF